jgi:hypothetical protein
LTAAGELTIGRSDESKLCLDDASVSREHARLWLENGVFHINDNKSSNGVFVNGRHLQAAQILHQNDIIQIGCYSLVFKPINAELKSHMEKYKRLKTYTAPRKGFGQMLGIGSNKRRAPTQALAPEQVQAIFADVQVRNAVVLQIVNEPTKLFPLEHERVEFGALGIPAKALTPHDKIDIVWHEDGHLINKSLLTSAILKVNGQATDSQRLQLEDEIQVGGTKFIYRLDSRFRKKLY